ncbi:hypothetical protein FGO68_gene9515 [Halteria grandinella]|uniref:Uncharacterized protein n=1 Tax=Halteria grandinella TaxID=5974 RepID=A0A8J8NSN4_HALGN|nr:hypothetical protein FGO68_gene9515 [Halteria grandinella]
MSLLTTVVFLYYAFTVETSKKCYYSEDLDQISPIDVKDMLTDVSHNFNVVIIGFAVTTLLDFILQVLRFTEVLPKFSSLIVILQLINFLVVIGFFIALHIVRFDRAGRECSTDDSLYRNFAVYERGFLLKAYVIAAWTLFGGICIGGIAFAMYLKKKQ